MPAPQKKPVSRPCPTSEKRPLKMRVAALIVFVSLLLLGMETWERWQARQMHLSLTRIATSNMARALGQHAEDTIRSADMVLIGMAERMEADGMHEAALRRMHAMLVRHAAELPLLHALSLYDKDGRALASSQPMPVQALDDVSRECFLFHRSHRDRGLHIGAPVRSRVTGEWVIPVSRRIDHAGATFAGVVLATIKMTHFRDFYESFDIGHAGAILLVLDNGTMLVRRPFDNQVIGTNVYDAPVFREYRASGPIGSAILKARVDGVDRLYSYRHLGAYGLLIAAAVSKEDILSDWHAATYRVVPLILLTVSGLAFLGFRLIRQIGIRERMEAELHRAKQALEERNRALEVLALNDSLTGLANRRQFEEVLQTELGRASRNGTALALLMIDIDYFKQYNDTCGHPAGDECLRRVSHAIKTAQQRPGDLAARYGGEEFAMLLPDTGVEGAMAVAEKTRLAVQDLQIAHSGSPLGIVTISVGLAAHVPGSGSVLPSVLMKAADEALYAAKAAGRNRVCNAGDGVQA